METNIIYKYLAHGATWNELRTLSYETKDLPSEVWNDPSVPHEIGDTLPLRPWHSFTDEPQNYKILHRFPLMNPNATPGDPPLMALVFVVTDPWLA